MKIILLIFLLVMNLTFANQDKKVDFHICEMANYNDKVKIFQGQDGWLFHSGDLVTDLEIHADALPYLAKLNKVLKQQGVRLIIANLPTRGMLHNDKFDNNQTFFKDYNNSLARYSFLKANLILNSTGILTPDLLQPFEQQGKPYDFSFARDSHWNSNGSRVVAQELSKIIRSLPEYQLMIPKHFETHVGKIRNRKTSLALHVERACENIKVPTELEQLYETLQVDNVTQTSNLFENNTIPEIVLVGTSNSARNQANFWGFLQDFLDIEVLNISVGAGGVWTAMKDYFIETEPINYPKIIVWEFPYRIIVQLNQLNQYRQLIPSIYGKCKQSLLTNKINILPNNLINLPLIINSDSLPITGNGYYLDIGFSDLSVLDFDVVIKHVDKQAEVINIQRSSRVQNNGKFFLEFSKDINSDVEEVSLSLPEDSKGTLEIHICKVPDFKVEE